MKYKQGNGQGLREGGSNTKILLFVLLPPSPACISLLLPPSSFSLPPPPRTPPHPCPVLLYCYLTRLTSRKADSKSMSQYKNLKTAGRGARSTIALCYVHSVIVMQRTLLVLLIREREREYSKSTLHGLSYCSHHTHA